tara:strand:- start:1678 stop:2451 length:774 start_codon:yes stop_codon:yes gene_type:complete
MFINNFDPVAIKILAFEIRWYSLSYIFGILIGWYYCKKFLIKDIKILNLFDDVIFYIILGIILGGRLGYVILYNPSYYIKNSEEIFMIWNGGMSFHGALIGIVLAIYFFSKRYKIDAFKILDLIAMVAPIGILFGRLANFINSELYGKSTEIPWAVKFINVDDLYRHPSQIYEAFFEGIVLFLLLNFIFKKFLFRSGIISSLFLIYYSIFRFFTEFTREPDPQIGYLILNLSMGQIISIVFFIAGIFLFYFKNENKS